METDIAEIIELRDTVQFLKIMQQIFEERVGSKPMFRITGTPTDLGAVSANLNSPELVSILEHPPTRSGGWTVRPLPPLRRNVLGFESDRIDYHHLKFIRNGHLEFWTLIDSHFCWRQDEQSFKQHPRLYPYPVVEYPLSFCRLYRQLVKFLNINSPIVFQVQYVNVKGVILLPDRPESEGFIAPMESVKPLDTNRLVLPKVTVPNDFDPDPTALELVQDVYFQFGYSQRHIPFFDNTGHSEL